MRINCVKRTIKCILPFVICLGHHAVSAKGISPNLKPSQSQALLQASMQDGWVQIGKGVFDPTGMPASGICMKDAKEINYKNGIGHLSLSNMVQQEELKSFLNLSVKTKAGWSKFSGSTSMNFSRNTQDDHYSRNFSYLQDFGWIASFEPNSYGKENLTTAGLMAYQKSPADFLNFCGDSFIDSAYAGVILAVNFKIQFSSHHDEQIFDSKFSAGLLGLGSITSNIRASGLHNTMNANIEIDALQIGGMPDKLANIFTKNSQGYYVTSCSFKDLNACDQIINGIIAYAQDLNNQVRDTEGQIKKDHLTFYKPSTELYSSWGLDLSSPIPNRDVIAAQASMQALYEKTQQYQIFVNHYIRIPELETDMIEFLKQQQNALVLRTIFLKIHGTDCYTASNMNQCPQLLDNINATFTSIPEYVIDEEKLDFVMHSWALSRPAYNCNKCNFFNPYTFNEYKQFNPSWYSFSILYHPKDNPDVLVWHSPPHSEAPPNGGKWTQDEIAYKINDIFYSGTLHECRDGRCYDYPDTEFHYVDNPA